MWVANRLVTDALMSLPPGVSWAGSHRLLFQASVNRSVYWPVGETGACAVPPGVSGLSQASRVWALLPDVVDVDSPVAGSVSHGPKAWTFSSSPVDSVHPVLLRNQQPTFELRGVCDGESRVGFAGKNRHFGSYGLAPPAPPPSSLVITLSA